MSHVDDSVLKKLAGFDSATIYNAVEKVQGVSNEDYTGPEIQYLTPEFGVVVGYAVTAEVTPLNETESNLSWLDYYDLLNETPGPMIAVMKDVDVRPKRGALFGDGMARIHKQLGVVGAVIEGAIRDLAGIREAGLPIWGIGMVSGHGPFNVRAIARPLVVGQMLIQTGDLILADGDGVVKIPLDIVEDTLKMANEIRSKERSFFDMVASPDFTYDDYKAWFLKRNKGEQTVELLREG